MLYLYPISVSYMHCILSVSCFPALLSGNLYNFFHEDLCLITRAEICRRGENYATINKIGRIRGDHCRKKGL